MFEWRWEFTFEILPRLIGATGKTLLAAGGGYAVALVLGLIFALAQRTPWRVLTVATREVVEFVRSTPLLLQVFFVYYVGPQFGLNLSPWTAGLAAIGLHYAAYLSEVYRGGIESVPKGQWEAAKALNMSTLKTYRRIVIPQALPTAWAGLGNYLVGIFKDTPMLSVIGVGELMHTANAVGAEHYRYLEPYTIVGLIFLAISLPTAWLVRQMEISLRRRLGLTK
ncbi:ectoine/hydroxyectoine ABC transporter permease subunit EhuD [Paracoccus sp. P2]|uniref:Amino acid ABC transporter membrane protein 2, PAAT family n=2 Tax=Paracoccus TaxID=265 RepID=A0A1N6YE81_9RHOB|nr:MULTISPECIES: ectoine/hydroxyectoine ABC transporter permease subunit EhuD [Paracoccus]HHY01274.1 ectoine/hydroxyectoine ABC transporter permease subunit EhuD [Paracoccus sp. (in: a-proteobacteria)]MDF3856596.1 ectoine/hydroxyectoine ABC transporter permease subunit EhuD [Paracoccus pantotrophus]QFG37749.1 ectoine/hydroxyectoine ABC transporter permease subunit EhuD [Paracoccus pantotrophus]RDD93209.1 ectoine/hydroxyectoine ABC transporter permease subunit EhuD [Paracoccus pantotrophus]RKS5